MQKLYVGGYIAHRLEENEKTERLYDKNIIVVLYVGATSEAEAKGLLLENARQWYPVGDFWKIGGVCATEIPQDVIDKYATPRPPSNSDTTWAVISDEQRGVGPDVPKMPV